MNWSILDFIKCLYRIVGCSLSSTETSLKVRCTLASKLCAVATQIFPSQKKHSIMAAHLSSLPVAFDQVEYIWGYRKPHPRGWLRKAGLHCPDPHNICNRCVMWPMPGSLATFSIWSWRSAAKYTFIVDCFKLEIASHVHINPHKVCSLTGTATKPASQKLTFSC